MTLIEVVIALGLLVVMLLGVAATLRSSQVSVALTTEHQAASREAFSQLDLVLATPFSSVLTLWDDATFDVTSPSTGAALPPAVSLGAVREVGRIDVSVDPDSDGSSDLLEVRVTINWRDMLGNDRSLEAIGRKAE
jgi:type II secretory pathway pseudopilin PulG